MGKVHRNNGKKIYYCLKYLVIYKLKHTARFKIIPIGYVDIRRAGEIFTTHVVVKITFEKDGSDYFT